jgi:phosphatidylserine/phosphatidylglycerophosphate/cardiolipin synthase-like enzyme
MINDPERNIHDRYTFNHAKYAVIDGRTVLIMSENWKETGFPTDNTRGNRGTGIIIRDESVSEYFMELFTQDYSLDNPDIIEFDETDPKYGIKDVSFDPEYSGSDDNSSNERIISWDYQPRFQKENFDGPADITPVISPDHSLLKSNSILELLGNAEKHIYIEQLQCYRTWKNDEDSQPNLYLEALLDAARRGCDVHILLDSSYIDHTTGENGNENVVNYINSIAEEEGLVSKLEARLINLEDKAGRNKLLKIHNKGIIVDGRSIYIGSMNWGYGGPIKNREVGVIISHSGIARYFENVFNFDWNLTLTRSIKTDAPYGTNLDLIPDEINFYYEIALFNLDNTNWLSLNLTSRSYQVGELYGDINLQINLDKDNIVIPPADFESVVIEIIMKQDALSPYDKYHNFENLWKFDSTQPSFLIELIGTGLNMTTTLLWLELSFEEPADSGEQFDINMDLKPENWNIKQVDPWLVLIMVIGAMVSISVLRDIGYRRLKRN